MRLYLDMDGVLMDYDWHIAGWGCDWKGPMYHHKPESEWTQEQLDNDIRYRAAMADPRFWRSMPPMSDAHVLWRHCRAYQPHVLTALPATGAAYKDRCTADKLSAIHRYFDPVFPQEHFHAVQRADKRQFAVPGAVLVDDMLPNCEEWTAAGGVAILHTSAVDTIRKLQELIHV